jgi:hypothetical protein
MGYDTQFRGRFDLDKKLTDAHATYLRRFADVRHMERDAEIAKKLPDPIREAVGLPIGSQGMYFTGTTADFRHDEDPSIIDYSSQPDEVPSLWCDWIPTKDSLGIEHDSSREKFRNYIEWIEFIIEHFLKPWGYVLNGEVRWVGENVFDDRGIIVVDNNVVTSKPEQA